MLVNSRFWQQTETLLMARGIDDPIPLRRPADEKGGQDASSRRCTTDNAAAAQHPAQRGFCFRAEIGIRDAPLAATAELDGVGLPDRPHEIRAVGDVPVARVQNCDVVDSESRTKHAFQRLGLDVHVCRRGRNVTEPSGLSRRQGVQNRRQRLTADRRHRPGVTFRASAVPFSRTVVQGQTVPAAQ